MLKIKWTDRIANEEDFQRVKEERILLNILKNRRHLWIGHIIRHNEFVLTFWKQQYQEKRPWKDPDYNT
jgi:hypothetical protein